MESSPDAHVARVKNHLSEGRRILESLEYLQTYAIPDFVPDNSQLERAAPEPDDPYAYRAPAVPHAR